MELIKQQVDYLSFNIKKIDFSKVLEQDYNIFKKENFWEFEKSNYKKVDGLQLHFYKKFANIGTFALHDQIRFKSQFFTEGIYNLDNLDFLKENGIYIEKDISYISRIDFCFDIGFNKEDELRNFLKQFLEIESNNVIKTGSLETYISKKNEGNELRIYDKKLWKIDMLKKFKDDVGYTDYLKLNYDYLSKYKYVYRIELQKNRKSLKDVKMDFETLLKSGPYFLKKYFSYYKLNIDFNLEITKPSLIKDKKFNKLESDIINNKLQYFYNSFSAFKNFSNEWDIDFIKSDLKGMSNFLNKIKDMEKALKKEKTKLLLSILKAKKFEICFQDFYINNKDKYGKDEYGKKMIINDYINESEFEIDDYDIKDDEFIKFMNSKKFNI